MGTATGRSPRIVFFPGLGCDRRIGLAHNLLPADVQWAEWLPVKHNEGFAAYAARLARANDVTEDCYLAGISLGGLAALHIAQRVRPRGVILIGSMRSSAGVNDIVRRVVEVVSRNLPASLHLFNCVPSRLGRKVFGLPRGEDYKLLVRMVSEQRKMDLKRLCDLAISVPEPVEPDCPVFSIHGTEDRVLNYFADETDVAIQGGGHFISVTHPETVNQAICNFLEAQIARETVVLPIPFALRNTA